MPGAIRRSLLNAPSGSAPMPYSSYLRYIKDALLLRMGSEGNVKPMRYAVAKNY